jgi:elongation factor Ts
VGGKKEASAAVKNAAMSLNMPYVDGRWIGGTISNFGQIRKRIERYEKLISDREKGELAKYTKRERMLIDKEIASLEKMFYRHRLSQEGSGRSLRHRPAPREERRQGGHGFQHPGHRPCGSDCDVSEHQVSDRRQRFLQGQHPALRRRDRQGLSGRQDSQGLIPPVLPSGLNIAVLYHHAQPIFIWSRKPRKPDTIARQGKHRYQLPNPYNKLQLPWLSQPNKIKALRDQTGVSVMQCKKALEEAKGDIEKALVILRKVSVGGMAAKKADRTFGAGVVQSYIHANGTVGAMVELDCETDFVANNDEFKTLARDIAMHVAATNPKFLKRSDITEADTPCRQGSLRGRGQGQAGGYAREDPPGQARHLFRRDGPYGPAVHQESRVTIQGLVDGAIQKFGEKTAVGRFMRFKILER